MLENIVNGWLLIRESARVFFKHPQFLIPLLITWLIYAPIILYLNYFFNWDALSSSQVLLFIFCVIFIFALLFSFSASMLLELIQQLESRQKINIIRSFDDTVHQNLLKLLPLVFVWTIIWFILLILQAIFSKSKDNEKQSATAENAAKTLAGYESFSLSKAFFQALQKGVRMVVFLILPAITWENLSFTHAVKRGVAIFKANLATFVSGFVLTSAISFVIFLPVAILFTISDEYNVVFSDGIWYITILYTALAWSYSMYLEQMFTAQLYLWHVKWEKEVKKAQIEGKPIPTINQVTKPSVLDSVNDLL